MLGATNGWALGKSFEPGKQDFGTYRMWEQQSLRQSSDVNEGSDQI